MKPRLLRLSGLCWVRRAAVLALVGWTGLRAADAIPVGERVVELPKFEVTDSRILPQPEKWRYAEIPGFEILSSLSTSATKRFVNDFLLLQDVMNVIMPGLQTGSAIPTSLILTGRGDAFDKFLPSDRGEDRYRTNSLFFQDAERGAIIVDFQLPELMLEDNTSIESDPYRGFYREYFRYVIRRNVGQKSPAWFEEGLVQLFAGIDFTKKWINFGMIGDGFGGERTGDFNRMLARRALIPMGELLQDPPKRRTTFWEAQSYAFVHLCLYGRNLKYQRPFLQFITRLDKEPLSEQLFKECFKLTYKQMALELRGYLDFTDHKYMQFSAKKGQSLKDPAPFSLLEAPDAVVGRIKGEALRLGGHDADARNALIAPYIRGERDPRLLAALGLDEKAAGQDDRARKFLEAAAGAKAVRARAYLELARLRLDEVRAKPGAANGLLTTQQVGFVLDPLFIARNQPPPQAAVYGLIAEAWGLSAEAPKSEHLAVVIEGIQRFPRDMALLMQVTLLAAKRGFADEAKALAGRGVKLAKEPGQQDRFRMIAAAFERDATPAAPVAAPKAAPAEESYLLKKIP
jgi:hypothetical protein